MTTDERHDATTARLAGTTPAAIAAFRDELAEPDEDPEETP